MASKLVKAGLAYTISNVILRGISFLSVPLFIRLLTTLEFGKYNVFISIEGVLYMISGFAIHTSIKNALYDKEATFDDYVKNCVYVDAVTAAALAVIANIVCLFYSEQIDLSFTEINLLMVAGFCQSLYNSYTAKLIMRYQYWETILISSITVIFGIALSVWLMLTILDDNRYYGRIFGAVGGQIVAAIYILRQIFKDGKAPIRISDWLYGLRISLPIVPHGISQIILSSSDRIMIKYIHNAVLSGIYSITYTLSLVPQVLFYSVSNIWEPWFFEKMGKGEYGIIKKGANRMLILMSSFFVTMACITPEVIRILATPDYYEAMDISVIILIGSYFAALYYIPCEIEYFYKKTQYIAISTVSCALLNILLNYVLLTYFSYKSAAVSTMICYGLYFLFHMLAAQHIHGKQLFNLWQMTMGIVTTVGLMTAAILMINHPLARYTIVTIVMSMVIVNNQNYIKPRLQEFLHRH